MRPVRDATIDDLLGSVRSLTQLATGPLKAVTKAVTIIPMTARTRAIR